MESFDPNARHVRMLYVNLVLLEQAARHGIAFLLDDNCQGVRFVIGDVEPPARLMDELRNYVIEITATLAIYDRAAERFSPAYQRRIVRLRPRLN